MPNPKQAKKKQTFRSPPTPKANSLKPAHRVLSEGVSSANSLLDLYEKATKQRGPGSPTHEEQDLLRAMLVMAGAALDATLKRLLTDAYPQVLERSPAARDKAAEHINRRLLAHLGEAKGRRLVSALLAPNPQEALAQLVVDDLTGQSLQSVKEISRVAEHLGLQNFLADKRDALKAAFEARNQIVHEMDAVLDGKAGRGRRKRRPRKKDKMHGHASHLLDVAAKLLQSVDREICRTRTE